MGNSKHVKMLVEDVVLNLDLFFGSKDLWLWPKGEKNVYYAFGKIMRFICLLKRYHVVI